MKNKGFSLFELMIVLAILGVISSFAVVEYRKYIMSSRIVVAKSALLENAALLEKHYAKYYTYKNHDQNKWPILPIPATEYFTIGFSAKATSSDDRRFILRAEPRTNYPEEKRYLELDHNGNMKICERDKNHKVKCNLSN